MTYAAFLLVFLLPPIALLGAPTLLDRTHRRRVLPWIAALALIALVYTTPWDNYLVAHRLWWYEPTRVSGLTIGWVPLEEYLFFILQPLATGLWTVHLLRRSPPASARHRPHPAHRFGSALALAAVWLVAVSALAAGTSPARYLALILVWAAPPLALQFLYGADWLWRLRGTALLAILPPTLYLAAADALAIQLGVWTINPEYSLGLNLMGVLPLEEFLFFLLTNCLIAFALLLLAPRIAWAARPQTA